LAPPTAARLWRALLLCKLSAEAICRKLNASSGVAVKGEDKGLFACFFITFGGEQHEIYC